MKLKPFLAVSLYAIMVFASAFYMDNAHSYEISDVKSKLYGLYAGNKHRLPDKPVISIPNMPSYSFSVPYYAIKVNDGTYFEFSGKIATGSLQGVSVGFKYIN